MPRLCFMINGLSKTIRDGESVWVDEGGWADAKISRSATTFVTYSLHWSWHLDGLRVNTYIEEIILANMMLIMDRIQLIIFCLVPTYRGAAV